MTEFSVAVCEVFPHEDEVHYELPWGTSRSLFSSSSHRDLHRAACVSQWLCPVVVTALFHRVPKSDFEPRAFVLWLRDAALHSKLSGKAGA